MRSDATSGSGASRSKFDKRKAIPRLSQLEGSLAASNGEGDELPPGICNCLQEYAVWKLVELPSGKVTKHG